MIEDVTTFEDTFDLEAQEKRQAELAAKQKRARAERERDYIDVMSTFGGRRFMWSFCVPIWRISYTGTRNDTDFREGERNVALRVWAELMEFCPTLAHKMQEENQK